MKTKIIIIILIILYLLNKKSKEEFQQSIFIPGMIMEWSGLIENIPSGWVLCDGNNGTPDLRGRFILGYNPNMEKYTIGKYGGTEKHTLTVQEIPSHNHGAPTIAGDNNTCVCKGGSGVCASKWDFTDGIGGSQPHNNMPPYYVLSYIMKI